MPWKHTYIKFHNICTHVFNRNLGTLCCFTFSLCAFHMKILTNLCISHMLLDFIWCTFGWLSYEILFLSQKFALTQQYIWIWLAVCWLSWFFFGRLLQCYFGGNLQWHNNFLVFRPMLFHWILHSDYFCGSFCFCGLSRDFVLLLKRGSTLAAILIVRNILSRSCHLTKNKWFVWHTHPRHHCGECGRVPLSYMQVHAGLSICTHSHLSSLACLWVLGCNEDKHCHPIVPSTSRYCWVG